MEFHVLRFNERKKCGCGSVSWTIHATVDDPGIVIVSCASCGHPTAIADVLSINPERAPTADDTPAVTQAPAKA